MKQYSEIKKSDRKLTKKQFAYKELKRAIMEGELVPRQALSEDNLCKILDVGRTPLRDAIQNLAKERMVEIIPNKGAFVASIGLKETMEIYELRISLEEMAIKLFISKGIEKHIKALQDCFEEQAQAMTSNDIERFISSDWHFHKCIIMGANNNLLNDVFDMLRSQIAAISPLRQADEDNRGIVYDFHKAIYDAIMEKDIEAAKKTTRKHLEWSKEVTIRNYLLSID